MAAVSHAPAVKAAIYDALTSAAGLSGVQVEYGQPSRDIERESLFLAGVEYQSEDWVTIGALQKEEQFSIGLLVRVEAPGDSQREATERAFQLFGVVESTLRTPGNQTLGGAWVVAVVPRRCLEGPYSEEGFGALIEADIQVKARK